jgi:hypothetical protein
MPETGITLLILQYIFYYTNVFQLLLTSVANFCR